jgi:hypothetical protein
MVPPTSSIILSGFTRVKIFVYNLVSCVKREPLVLSDLSIGSVTKRGKVWEDRQSTLLTLRSFTAFAVVIPDFF